MLLFGLIIYSSVVSNGSSMMMLSQVQYILYSIIFTSVIQIFFAVFHRDIPHHFTHRLSCEYKGNISSANISKMCMIIF